MRETAIIETPVQAVEQEGPVWLEALPAREYHTPFYGKVPVTLDKLNNFVKHFKEGVRGQEIPVDFEHGMDRAKGDKAAGWFKDVKVDKSSDDPTQFSLWVQADFTEEAKKEIKDRQWKYVSLDWEDEWTDNDGNKFSDVIAALGLTNRPVAKKIMPINFSEKMLADVDTEGMQTLMAALMEHKELEHSEPGTGSPPAPRTDEDGSDDIAITEGWRRFTPPPQEPGTEGQPSGMSTNTLRGGKMSEYVFDQKNAQELLRILELPVDAEPDTVVEAAKVQFGELHKLRESADKEDQEKLFAERYPAFWTEHNRLMERDRINTATQFSESVKPIRRVVGKGLVDTGQALSAAAQTKLVETHKKFSEGTATVEDFEECIKAITNGGIVQFGELGSGNKEDEPPEVDTSSATGAAHARKVFSEIVDKFMEEDKELDYRAAMDKAAKQYPDLAEAYRVALPA